MPAVAVEAARAMPQADDRALADGRGTTRVLSEQRPKQLAIPALRMFDVQNGVQGEINALFRGNAQALQTSVDKSGPCGRRHLDHAERADRLEAVAAVAGQTPHGLAPCQAPR